MPASDLDLSLMAAALQEAEAAAGKGEVPVGAVVYHHLREAVVGRGHNLRESLSDPTAHAEMIAMREAAAALGSWRLCDCTLVVTLEPCPMCAGAMVNARVPRLVYGAADPKMGCVSTLYELCTDPRFNHRLEVIGKVMAEPCGQILRDFFRARRRRRGGER